MSGLGRKNSGGKGHGGKKIFQLQEEKELGGKRASGLGRNNSWEEDESGGKRVSSKGGKRSVPFSGGKRVLLWWGEMALLGKR